MGIYYFPNLTPLEVNEIRLKTLSYQDVLDILYKIPVSGFIDPSYIKNNIKVEPTPITLPTERGGMPTPIQVGILIPTGWGNETERLTFLDKLKSNLKNLTYRYEKNLSYRTTIYDVSGKGNQDAVISIVFKEVIKPKSKTYKRIEDCPRFAEN